MVRHAAAVVLVFVLMLTGIGRGLALASTDSGTIVRIAGVAVPICHADAGHQSGAPDSTPHDCCDSCLLLASTILPVPPDLAAPAVLAYFAKHIHAVAWVPVTARLRTPRQSQGPPTG